MSRTAWVLAAAMTALAFPVVPYAGLQAEPPLPAVDTALVLAVDVSNSVDEQRYRLQIEGIARAVEDPGVMKAVLGGVNGAIAVALVEWADDAVVTLDWEVIRSAEDAQRVAAGIRALTHRRGEYTCMARMMRIVDEHVFNSLPATADRLVLDVSGDGIDNCADPSASDEIRDELIGRRVTINGLPIIVEGENQVVGSGAYRAPGYGLRELPSGPDTGTTTLDAWFYAHVVGGPAAFLLPANGYQDFGRAFRQKFVTEISAAMSEGDTCCGTSGSFLSAPARAQVSHSESCCGR